MNEPRRPRPPGRHWRRARREPVSASPSGWQYEESLYRDFPPDPDDPDYGGSAGVREPRHPKPLGPMSGAGEAPIPAPMLAAQLPDPRR